MSFARSLPLLFAILISYSVSSSLSAAELAGSQPNIILVMTDDQGYAPVGRHGHPWIETPNLDSLYDESTRFTRFLVSPTCSPTRSALMTGRHPMKNGITHTILERERMTLDATILPQVLKSAGYATGIFGKWHLGDEEPYQPHQRGFNETFIHGAGGIGQAYDCSCADAPDNSYFDPIVRHNGSFVKTDGFCTDVFFKAARGWIKSQQAADQPFFAYITTNAPHGPFLAPPEDKQRFLDRGFTETTAGFYGMIENIDQNMGRLLKEIEESNLAENTMVIFMSDNGMTGAGSGRLGQPLGQAEPGKVDSNKQLFPYNAEMNGLKGNPHEGGVRVPFFVRWPGKIQPGQDIDRIAAHIDLLPTLAALTGAALPENQVEGRSLLPLIEDPTTEWSDRYLFTHVARWPTGADPDQFQWKNFAIRNQQYRFVNNDQLFDMQKDPGETINVIEDHPEVVEQMRTAYEKFWQETRPLMVNEDAPLSKTRPYHELYKAQMKSTGIPEWKPPAL
ncbi:Arylsulfatase precursor [Polystyrenella longa]|uniref:Arylsulfatase n=1 Tax=Polystyrenella longa TaxID=2528007 RepID=A0A518CKB2_9PLAN|nr:arylsulfatase [Polystyrenella longa]QDU79668.1 Arylsulfatase precursor [Polystyrenella longa]